MMSRVPELARPERLPHVRAPRFPKQERRGRGRAALRGPAHQQRRGFPRGERHGTPVASFAHEEIVAGGSGNRGAGWEGIQMGHMGRAHVTGRARLALVVALAPLGLALVAAGCTGGGHSSSGFSSQASTGTTTPGTTTPGSTTPAPVGSSSSGATTAPVASSLPPIPTYGTRQCWPIVLVHGTPGWNTLGGIEYWYGIPELLRSNGFEVFVVEDTAFASIAERAGQLHDQIVAQYPDPRVKLNIIGHSMGGIDSRYAIDALGLGDRVVSLTTVGTPHHGTSLSDAIFGVIPGPAVALANVVVGLVGWDLTGLQELSVAHMTQTFNPQNPDDPRVTYFSWAGVADPIGQTNGCVLDPLFIPTWTYLIVQEGANDGLVSQTSAQWGSFQGVLPADHMNEVDQPLGMTAANFDAKGFYEKWAEQLEAQGFGP